MGYKDTNKYFLTGFTLIGTLGLFIVTLFMGVGLQVFLIIKDIDTQVLLISTFAVAVITSLFYRNSKKDLLDSEEYSRVVVNYIRTTITISLLVISLFSCYTYISILLLRNLDGFFISFAILLILIMSLYIEGLALLTLFVSCCALRDVDRYNEKILYILMFVVLAIIGYGLSKYIHALGIAIIPIYLIVALVLVTIYMVKGLKDMLSDNEVETISDRYKFATKALTYTIVAPVNIPVKTIVFLIKKFKKQEKYERV